MISKGCKLQIPKKNPGPLNTHCLAGTVFHQVSNLNAFMCGKHSPVGPRFLYNPWSNILGISPTFLMCLAPEDIWNYRFWCTLDRNSGLQVEIRGQPTFYKGPDSKYSRFCGPYDLLSLLNTAVVVKKQP